MAKRLMARVRALREAKDLSQEAFAERAGLKYKHYQAMEAGRRLNFQFVTLQKLAKGCGLNLSELFDFDAPVLSLGEHPGSYEAKSTSASSSPRARG
jgi:transcriptional regulator with XRE-family HTH domain